MCNCWGCRTGNGHGATPPEGWTPAAEVSPGEIQPASDAEMVAWVDAAKTWPDQLDIAYIVTATDLRIRQDAAELAKFRADLAAAAGECCVPIPEPGTDMAKLLTANVLMRREIERLRGSLRTVKEKWEWFWGWVDAYVTNDEHCDAAEAVDEALRAGLADPVTPQTQST
jgi:hypothetical protein